MNQIVEAVRQVFSPQPSISQMRAALALGETKLAAAQAELTRAKAAHGTQALEFASQRDGGAALARSRRAVDDANALVQDLEAGLAAARTALASATDADELSALLSAWDRAAALLEARSVAFENCQAKLDAFVATLEPLKRLNEEAYAALPVRPDFRPTSSTPGGMAALIDLYLHGASNGWLGKVGLSPYMARMRPTLGGTARDLAKRLLANDPRKVKA